MPTLEDLRYLQSLPLDLKISMTKARLREWVRQYGESGVYVLFSGGKDSTVLLDIVRSVYPNVKAVFVDTGLEYPEIKEFVKSFENVDIIRPKMTFKDVICKYGYPMLSKKIAENVYSVKIGTSKKGTARYDQLFGLYKNSKTGEKSNLCTEKYIPLLDVDFVISGRCCNVMKKSPANTYNKTHDGAKPITAQMAVESLTRQIQWLRNSCNGFDLKHPISNPMSFWDTQDVLQYIKDRNLKIASVYGEIRYEDYNGQQRIDGCGKLCTTGCQRTGCVFCGFGAHLEKGEGRFERLKRTHPKLYEYCMNGGEYCEDGIWRPNSKGLGMKHVIDTLNSLYGKDFIKY